MYKARITISFLTYLLLQNTLFASQKSTKLVTRLEALSPAVRLGPPCFLPTLQEYRRTNCVRRELQQNVKYATCPRLSLVIFRPVIPITRVRDISNPRDITI